MSRTIRGNPYLSKRVGSKEPPQHKVRRPVAFKEVFIGNHNPGDHYAPAAGRFIPAEELYDNRPRKQKR